MSLRNSSPVSRRVVLLVLSSVALVIIVPMVIIPFSIGVVAGYTIRSNLS